MKSFFRANHPLGILLGVGLAACSPEESSLEVEPVGRDTQAAGQPGALTPGASADSMPLECRTPKPCMRYRIPLQGNPVSDVALRNNYIAAFGDACYMSELNTFDCWYMAWQAACSDAVKIGEIFAPNAPYDKGYACQPIPGSDDYTLQIGPDVANKITIYYDIAPRQSLQIDVNGTPTAVNGPYRNLPDPDKVEPGRKFDCSTRKDIILQANRKAHGGALWSDLWGYTYPCPEMAPMMCMEPKVLKNGPQYDPDAAQVHHVVPKTDLRSCRWGDNSNKNAAVISSRLNKFLRNKVPPADEVAKINAIPPYPP